MSNILLVSELFGHLFLVNNALTLRCNQHLRDTGVSTVQWLLCAALGRQPGQAANLSTLAGQLCTSRQNVKQLARSLADKGWLTMARDPADSRSLLLTLSPACQEFWSARADADAAFLDSVFGRLDEADLACALRSLRRVYALLADGAELPS
jgi:DNA-binding MarR family transcriptional regulator